MHCICTMYSVPVHCTIYIIQYTSYNNTVFKCMVYVIKLLYEMEENGVHIVAGNRERRSEGTERREIDREEGEKDRDRQG